ncbi:MAG: signal peptidase II [Clostridia bacterium]|nr:signal peptidase II [Clostridia bacterium]
MLISIIIAALAVILDQISKQMIMHTFFEGQTLPIIKNVLHITYVTNDGAAFGMFDDCRWLFMIISVLAVIALPIVIHFTKKEGKLLLVSLSMVWGGGIGNLIDRFFYPENKVVDFIDFRLINFAVFNIADSFVTVGCVLMIVWCILSFIKEKEKR